MIPQPAAKKGRAAPQAQVKINKQQANKVSRQMENAGKYIFISKVFLDGRKYQRYDCLFRFSHFCHFPATSFTYLIFKLQSKELRKRIKRMRRKRSLRRSPRRKRRRASPP
jgi:hypothetical protein